MKQSGLFSNLQSHLYFAAAALVNPKAVSPKQFEPVHIRSWDPYATQGQYREPQFKALYTVVNRLL